MFRFTRRFRLYSTSSEQQETQLKKNINNYSTISLIAGSGLVVWSIIELHMRPLHWKLEELNDRMTKLCEQQVSNKQYVREQMNGVEERLEIRMRGLEERQVMRMKDLKLDVQESDKRQEKNMSELKMNMRELKLQGIPK